MTPTTSAMPELATAPAAGGQTDAAKPAQMLLVEDECALRELLVRFLETRGYCVHAVSNGRLAAEWLARHRVDLVLTDLCMPEADGIELLMQLRKAPVRVPVIAMSGGINGNSDTLLRMAAMLGARRTLPKPFPLDELAATVRELTGR